MSISNSVLIQETLLTWFLFLFLFFFQGKQAFSYVHSDAIIFLVFNNGKVLSSGKSQSSQVWLQAIKVPSCLFIQRPTYFINGILTPEKILLQNSLSWESNVLLKIFVSCWTTFFLSLAYHLWLAVAIWSCVFIASSGLHLKNQVKCF